MIMTGTANDNKSPYESSSPNRKEPINLPAVSKKLLISNKSTPRQQSQISIQGDTSDKDKKSTSPVQRRGQKTLFNIKQLKIN